MEGNASLYEVNLVSRTTGEGTAGFSRMWGPGLDQGGGGGGTCGAAQSVRGNNKSFLWRRGANVPYRIYIFRRVQPSS